MSKRDQGSPGLFEYKVAGVSLRDLIVLSTAVFVFTGGMSLKDDVATAKSDQVVLANDLQDAKTQLATLQAQVALIDTNRRRIQRLTIRVDELNGRLRDLDANLDDILRVIGRDAQSAL